MIFSANHIVIKGVNAAMTSEKLNIDERKTALIVVDMTNAFLDDRGSMVKLGLSVDNLKATLPPVKRLVEACRIAHIPVIFTRNNLQSDYSDAGRLADLRPAAKAEQHNVGGTWGVEIHPELNLQASDYVIDKTRASAFYNTNLDGILRGRHIETVVVCGVTTEICVESTVRDAYFRDYWVVVVKDAVAAVDSSRHAGSLLNIEFGFGRLATTDEVIAALPVPVS